jgi:hypothetical protein
MAGGWAKRHSEREPQSGRGLHGVYLSEMPARKPWIPRRRIKGVAGPTGAAETEDVPGGGTWYDARTGR